MGLAASLSQPTKLAIASDFTAGLTAAKVAAKYGVSSRSVNRVISELRKSPIDTELVRDWRTTINSDALVAVRSGINCDDDKYKAATLGIAWLKGTGLLLPDNTTQINNLFASMPADWVDEFAPPAIDVAPESGSDNLPTSTDPLPALPESVTP